MEDSHKGTEIEAVGTVLAENQPESAGAETPDETYVALPLQYHLDSQTIRGVMARGPTRIVILAGLHKSGKTTLVASLYEAFLRKPSFAGFLFAGSETLLGFEQRCHFAREASGLTVPQAERTTQTEEIPFLHLRVSSAEQKGERTELLFTDVAGEVFRAAKDSTEFMFRLDVLKRADRTMLLIDGALVVDPVRRFEATNSARDFLRRALDSEMLGSQSRVDLLVTKYDLIQALSEPRRAAAEAYTEDAYETMERDFGGSLRALRFEKVAARPDPGSELPDAYGLERLLPIWIAEGLYTEVPRRILSAPKLSREIDKFVTRQGLEVLRQL